MATKASEPDFPPARDRIGGNRAPIEQQVVIDLDEGLTEAGVLARIDALATKGAAAPACTDADMAGDYTDTVKLIITARKSVEDEREIHNRPLLTAQRLLKGRADAIVAPLAKAEENLRFQVKTFRDAEKAKADQLAREEEERVRLAEEAAENERRRLQSIADEAAAVERDRLQEIEDARAAKESRDVVEIAIVAPVVEVAPVYVPRAAPPAPVAIQGNYSKVAETTTWKHRIVSVRQLPDNILKHAKVIEALDKVIAAQVRGGIRELKGCEIFPETGLAIR